MNCEKCGEVCQCPMEPSLAQIPNSGVPAAPDAGLASEFPLNGTDSDAWRSELSARLNRYRSRRKAPPPRYPSLRLPFGPAAPALDATGFEDPVASPVLHSAANQDLLPEPREPEAVEVPRAQRAFDPVIDAHSARRNHPSAKIIEFPRFAWGPPPSPADQLAEPVMDRPRILEVPEVAPPPPALGRITIEPVAVEENHRRPGIDIPLQSAPLSLRLVAAFLDWLIIGVAAAIFGLIFWKIALVRPPQIQLLSLAVGIPLGFWAAYQYLLIVYAGTTPGLRMARLDLVRFDGTSTSRSLRRWRVIASYLSAASLGMGYAWLFLDEDALCWHDRITHTYLAPRKKDSKS